MLLRPHFFSTPPCQADHGDLTEEMGRAAEGCSNRLSALFLSHLHQRCRDLLTLINDSLSLVLAAMSNY